MDTTSANVYWHATSSLIRFHLSCYRVITTMQPRRPLHSFSAGRTFKLGIFCDDPPEPPHTILEVYTFQDFALPVSFHRQFEGSLLRPFKGCTV